MSPENYGGLKRKNRLRREGLEDAAKAARVDKSCCPTFASTCVLR
jgi:hypothetical protein